MEEHFVLEPQGKPLGKSTAGLAGRDSRICELPDFSRADPVPYAMKFFQRHGGPYLDATCLDSCAYIQNIHFQPPKKGSYLSIAGPPRFCKVRCGKDGQRFPFVQGGDLLQ